MDPEGKEQPPSRRAQPRIGRPAVPPIYGIPDHKKDLLDWPHVSSRMAQALIYWVSTVSPRGLPHATPVDGLWHDEALYFAGSPESRRHRNLAQNKAVCVHLESGTDVVILHGDAEKIEAPERSFAIFLARANREKYGYGPGPAAYEGGGLFLFRPRKVLAWTRFPSDATRFLFEG